MKNFIYMFLIACMSVAEAGTVFLDIDSVATGSTLDSTPLLTSEGTITFTGEITTFTDPEFTAVGASGNNLDILSAGATLDFDFDVSDFTFIFGGNIGNFSIFARDILNNTIDSFSQASTNGGEFAGPYTLTGTGIRSVFWNDTSGAFAPIDNITITTNGASIPEPTSLALLGLGLAGFGFSRKKKKA